ncbi:MAG: NADH-quinone oxidoreductase subunit C [Rickettsiaceae bacterium]
MQFKNIIDEFIDANNLNVSSISVAGFTAYKVNDNSINQLLSFVKEDKKLRFTILTDLFAADFLDRANRFEVVYSLLSLQLNQRLLFKIELAENKTTLSTANIFSASCWYEREIFDMYGIEFENCPDMRRILTDYSFVGHPLRKDFPLTGHVQVRYDDKLEKVIYEPVNLEQEFRDFDFTSPWRGPEGYKLPGDEKATK